MKRMRGLSAVSAVCMALTGIAGAIPALPAPAAVYAAENTDAAETEVSAEVLQFCKDALSALDGYQAQYFTRDETANVEFLYFYGSDLLKKAGKKGTVPFSELEAAGELILRVQEQPSFTALADLDRFLAAGHRTGDGGDYSDDDGNYDTGDDGSGDDGSYDWSADDGGEDTGNAE